MDVCQGPKYVSEIVSQCILLFRVLFRWARMFQIIFVGVSLTEQDPVLKKLSVCQHFGSFF